MKKLTALMLALLMLTGACAFAETAATDAPAEAAQPMVVEAPVEFDAEDITIDALAIGFQIPMDFVKLPITEEQIAQGLVLNATDADATYQLQATVYEADIATFEEQLSATPGVSDVATVVVNDIEYITYVMAEQNINFAALFINDTQLLSFAFIVPQGVDVGTTPFQIMGSLFDL